jgi:hypothetical protein
MLKHSSDGEREAEGTGQYPFECIQPDQNPSHATHIPKHLPSFELPVLDITYKFAHTSVMC